MNARRATGALLPLLLLAGVGCGQSDEGPRSDAGASEEPTPHGYVEGAEETAEHQPRLVTLEESTGVVQLVDLVTEKVTPLGRVEGARSVTGDGRFAYVGTPRHGQVYDSGVWMVDHGDHVHYYRAKPREVGRIPGGAAAGAYSDTALTALTSGDGAVGLLNRKKLEDGKPRLASRLPGGGTSSGTSSGTSKGAAVPYGKQLLVPQRESDGTDRIRVHGRDGKPRQTLKAGCPELEGQAVTARGVVFGCADGALLVSAGDEGGFSATKIRYPQEVTRQDRAREFRHRSGSSTLAARAGKRGVWTLDVTDREWKRIDTGRTVLAVNSVGEDEPALALTEDGVLRAYDPDSGKQTAQRRLLAKPVSANDDASPVIELDTTRAYVNDARAKKVHEVDYQDELRIARSISLPAAPTHMVETGR